MAATNAPKDPKQRRRRNVPERGEWQSQDHVGWQHGPMPKPPKGLTDVTRKAWRTWFASWFAAYWHPHDLPGLDQVARLYDECVLAQIEPVIWPPADSNGKPVKRTAPASELRLYMDTYGITPKGQQDRRWREPEKPTTTDGKTANPYGHLRVVNQK